MADQAKRDARAFFLWFNEASPSWPDDLKRLGTFAMLALKTLDHPNPGDVLIREAAKDLAAFNNAYAEFMSLFCSDCGATLPTHKPGCHDGPKR